MNFGFACIDSSLWLRLEEGGFGYREERLKEECRRHGSDMPFEVFLCSWVYLSYDPTNTIKLSEIQQLM